MPISEIQYRTSAGNYQNKLAEQSSPLKKTLAAVKMLYDRDAGKALLDDIAEINNTPMCTPGPARKQTMYSLDPVVASLAAFTALSMWRPDITRLLGLQSCSDVTSMHQHTALSPPSSFLDKNDIAHGDYASSAADRPQRIADPAYPNMSRLSQTIKKYDPHGL